MYVCIIYIYMHIVKLKASLNLGFRRSINAVIADRDITQH